VDPRGRLYAHTRPAHQKHEKLVENAHLARFLRFSERALMFEMVSTSDKSQSDDCHLLRCQVQGEMSDVLDGV